MVTMKPLSRRTVLRGAGVALALPAFEALAQTGAKSPNRLAVLYMPNGVNPFAWTPKGTGSQFELSEILAPLAPVIRSRLRLNESLIAGCRALGALRLCFSADGSCFAGTPLGSSAARAVLSAPGRVPATLE